jgi:hypothetical protein
VDSIFTGVIRTYANEHPDTFAGAWTDRDAGGTYIVAFTDDSEPHRQALARRRPQPTDDVGVDPRPPIADDRPIGEWEQTFDVVQVQFTEAQLEAAQEQVNVLFDEPDVGLSSTGRPTSLNRVSIELLEPTIENVAALTDRVPVDRVCVNGEPLDPDREIYEPGDELHVIVVPDEQGRIPADTNVTCGFREFPLSALAAAEPIEARNDPGLIDEVEAFLSGPEGEFWPQHGWHVLTSTNAEATLISADAGGEAFISFESTRAGWSMTSASGYGKCKLQTALPDALGDVGWKLDKRFEPPGPESTEIHVRVQERGCAGGQAIGDRLLGPERVETGDAVLLTFAAITQPGAHTCPGNPSTAVTVALPSPLGDRQIRDGRNVAVDISDHLGTGG